MNFATLLDLVGTEPVFESGLLLAGARDPVDVRRQLSRWVAAGRLYRLRRGLYALAPPFSKIVPHPFLVANRLVRGSYVTCQSALAYHGWIPEHVVTVTSVSASRPQRFATPLGQYDFRHLKKELIRGDEWVAVATGQSAFVAWPEKALLDLVYLEAQGDSPEYLRELRLSGLEHLNRDRLVGLAKRSGKPKLERAAREILQLAASESLAYEDL
jgi:hypothetical protein